MLWLIFCLPKMGKWKQRCVTLYTMLLTARKTFQLSLGRKQQDSHMMDLLPIHIFPSCDFELHIAYIDV